MNIYIMRHGETEWNRKRKIQGQSDIPLNEYGKKIANLTNLGMQHITFDKIISSPLLRTRETATLMAEGRNLQIEIEERIMEIGFGEGEGMLIDDINADKTNALYDFIHHPENYHPMTGGESLNQIKQRCISFMEEVLIPLENEIDNLLIVSHGAFIRIMISLVQGYGDEQLWERKKHNNCAVTHFKLVNEKFSLIAEGENYYEEKLM